MVKVFVRIFKREHYVQRTIWAWLNLKLQMPSFATGVNDGAVPLSNGMEFQSFTTD